MLHIASICFHVTTLQHILSTDFLSCGTSLIVILPQFRSHSRPAQVFSAFQPCIWHIFCYIVIVQTDNLGYKQEDFHMAILGCIADDFTGASDAASFLVKGGSSITAFRKVPPI